MPNAYLGWLSDSSPRVDVYSVKLAIIRWLAAFHRIVVMPVARQYSTWALVNLVRASSLSSEQKEAAETTVAEEQNIMLSRSEKIRIFQVLYRYKTYYHSFGRNLGRRQSHIPAEEINNTFSCLILGKLRLSYASTCLSGTSRSRSSIR